MVPMILMAMIMASQWVEGNTWLAVLSEEASFEDAIYFPQPDNCKFVLCYTDTYYVYGRDCTRVPEYPGQPEPFMIVLATKMEVLKKEYFDSWSHLRSLTINMNSNLKEIEEGAFATLSLLTNLTITNNYNLNSLASNVFAGLTSLEELRFIKNNAKSIFSLTLASRPFILPSLKYLDLSDNTFQELTREDFTEMAGSVLETLTLNMCGIYSIQTNTFSPFKELKVLHLDINKLSTEALSKLVINLNKTSPHLTHLGIGSNFLNKNPYEFLSLVADTKISSLNLKENHFEFVFPSLLEESPFPLMPNIEVLDLSAVSGYELQPWTLGPALPNLRRLIFTNNRLPGFLPGLRLSSLKELDLSENVCENCQITTHFEIEENSLSEMILLESLTLSNNYIFQISRYMFKGLTSLRTMHIANCSLITISEYSFENLSSLNYLDISRNNFRKVSSLPAAAFFGLANLTSLRLDSCDLDGFSEPEIFRYLSKLKFLSLNDNQLVELDPLQFAQLTNLNVLDVSNNGILPWNGRVFSNNKNLQKLILNSNHIYKFTGDMLHDFSELTVLKLRNNPFSCNCVLVRVFLDFKVDYLKSSYGISDPAVKCYLPKLWADKRVADFLLYRSESYECLPWSFIWMAIGIILLLLLIVGIVISYYLRWYIRYWIFLFRQKWRSNFPGKNHSATYGKYKYDAFVSYSNEDRNFVIRLVAMLENYDPHYRLCVYERDFIAGDIISNSVVDSLSSSRKSILILTDGFARSQWCQWEMQMAQHKRIFFKQEGQQDSLILVKLGDVMDSHMTPTLRYLMKTRIYLQWHSDPKRQRVFWEKLREALRPSVSDILSA